MRDLISGRREGIALITVLLVVVAVAAISASAIVMGSTVALAAHYEDRQNLMAGFAEAGVEELRADVNARPGSYPTSSFTTFESGDPVYDAAGNVVPGLKRWLYVGPTGVTSGQYGVFGSAVAIVQDGNGDRVVRRQEIMQESFAKYAYFTNSEGAGITFGGGDVLFGPVHSNDELEMYNPGTYPVATFNGPVTTAMTVLNAAKAQFNQGFTNGAPRITMPVMSDLTKLQVFATTGGTAFTNSGTLFAGDSAQANMRIQFVALDLDGDGSTTGADEGFIAVYSDSANFVVASVPLVSGTPTPTLSRNCGHYEAAGPPGNGQFRAAAAPAHPFNGHSALESLRTLNHRCFLGGALELTNNVFQPAGWVAWAGAVDPRVTASVGADIDDYLIPISRALNPNFKGVIYVTGKVAISGVVRGRVTLAATGNVIIADDLTYSTVPGSGTCTDILGIFSGGDVIVADNSLNTPIGTAADTIQDETAAESIHAVVLALGTFKAQNAQTGPTTGQSCEGSAVGRGCLFLQGGVIQGTRGSVGSAINTGYKKRYSYDPCAFTNPPPYFPTTGHFVKARYFEVDPTGFTINGLFDSLTPTSP
jgi:hypothetical protein